MRDSSPRGAALALAFGLLWLMGAPRAEAVHFFRGDGNEGCGSGCCPADGEVSDDPTDPSGDYLHGPITGHVLLLHNTFNDEATLLPIVRIKAGEAVEWKWASSHCHSVRGNDGTFYSHFYYPEIAPESPKVVPGFLEYPIPDDTPTLRYVHTFIQPGMYSYECEHHNVIGMVGMVIVDP